MTIDFYEDISDPIEISFNSLVNLIKIKFKTGVANLTEFRKYH